MSTTPAARKYARQAMDDAMDAIYELVCQLDEDDILEHYPEIASLANEARHAVAKLRHARANL